MDSRRKFKEGIREILSDLKTKFNDDAEATETAASPGFRNMPPKPRDE